MTTEPDLATVIERQLADWRRTRDQAKRQIVRRCYALWGPRSIT